ncbi:hypothetical protein ACHAWF_003113, partial [Thalassiosira exigua]
TSTRNAPMCWSTSSQKNTHNGLGLKCKRWLVVTGPLTSPDLSIIATFGNHHSISIWMGINYSNISDDKTGLNLQVGRRLEQMYKADILLKCPGGGCLSPLGEYNLILGIQNVIELAIFDTARDKPSAYNGHPFIVQTAVSLGGKDIKEEITAIHFAKGIPLPFEDGADVATHVAYTYKIDYNKDKICDFSLIISTKTPFKGIGKEYIGNGITEIQLSVKCALQNCSQQPHANLVKGKYMARRQSVQIKTAEVSVNIFGWYAQTHQKGSNNLCLRENKWLEQILKKQYKSCKSDISSIMDGLST